MVKGRYSIFQARSKATEVIAFVTAADLERIFQSLAARSVDAVFHAAAVSDFRFGKVWTRLASGELKEVKQGKFSTREAPLLAELSPVPKLLSQLRGWFPKAWLVGWKYEVEGGPARAIARAKAQIRETQTDACVVNGPAYGEGFGYLAKSRKHVHLANAPALFNCLEKNLPR